MSVYLILKKSTAVMKFSCFVLLVNSYIALWRFCVMLNNVLERLCKEAVNSKAEHRNGLWRI